MATHPIENAVANPSADREAAVAATLGVLAYLRDVRPVWSHEPPTREGYYWVRGGKRDEVTVVHVTLDYSEKEVPFVVQSGSAADTGAAYLRDYHDCQWCGPLEFPHES